MALETHDIDAYLAMAIGGGPLPSTADWDEERDAAQVRTRMRFHGVAGLLAARGMQRLGPPWLQAMAEAEARFLQIWEETHRAALLPVIAALDQSMVPAAFMKGTALAYTIYPAPDLRARGDSDLLVEAGALPQVRDILAGSGFRRHPAEGPDVHQECWSRDREFGFCHQIDLHWGAHPLASIRRLLDAEALLDARQPLPRLSPHAYGCDPVRAFVHGIINQGFHSRNGFIVDGQLESGAGRLGWIYDNHLLALSFRDADWDQLVAISLKCGIAPSVRNAIETADRLRSTPVPDGVMRDLAFQTEKCRLAHYLYTASPAERLWADLRAAKTLRDAVSQVRRHLFPAHVRSQVSPSARQGPALMWHYGRRIVTYPLKSLRRWFANA